MPVKWLEKNAHVLQTLESRSSLKDLEPLREMIGSASIVGLGEAAHGTHEIFKIKHRFVEFLVSEMGFTNLVLEENWGSALRLDHYVLTGEGDLSGILNPVFNTREVTDMLEWVRSYNADPRHEEKVRIIGMDIQQVDESVYNKITDYIRPRRPDLLPVVTETTKALLPDTKDISLFSSLSKEDKDRRITEAQEIRKILEQNKEDLGGQANEFQWVLQSARIIEQFTTMAAVLAEQPSEFFLKHDIAMFENAKWTQENLGRTIVWAHNGHISKENLIPFVYPKVSGQHLAEYYQEKYVTIGTSVYQGKYNAYNSQNDFGPHGTLQSNPDSINYTLGQVRKELFFVDLRKAGGLTKAWLEESHPFFAGVTAVGPDIPTTVDIPLGSLFDILIQIRKVTPSQLIRQYD
ncbi:erythromycin esterase family protein [Paenibacillus lutrae]|uniref:Erythromycin esterase family protein n=1 Tax=Paenibacillus lutrae TaxID=2078573 RepID=A0A7X3FEU3_9BACL|nr:erythromycin esterase family protein [Paenibacillus lutrae]MVO98391.1 erythromycin esterase family protein [Paenibacillus lutrae]